MKKGILGILLLLIGAVVLFHYNTSSELIPEMQRTFIWQEWEVRFAIKAAILLAVVAGIALLSSTGYRPIPTRRQKQSA